MPIRSWRRLHGAHLIAQLDPVPEFGTWSARAWVEAELHRSRSSPRQFELLTSAHATADLMVCEGYNHRCDLATCGDWNGATRRGGCSRAFRAQRWAIRRAIATLHAKDSDV
jgi:hypothetical protein